MQCIVFTYCHLLTWWPIFSDLVFMFCSTIPLTQKSWMICITGLLPQQKVYHFQVHTNLSVISCTIDLHDYFLYWSVVFFMECPVGMGAYLLVLCSRTHFKLCLELAIKSCQSLALYCPTPRKRRTCPGPLQCTRSVVYLKIVENSASWFL